MSHNKVLSIPIITQHTSFFKLKGQKDDKYHIHENISEVSREQYNDVYQNDDDKFWECIKKTIMGEQK